MAGQKVKFAIIGCGRIGKRHAEVISHTPEAELCAVIDVSPAAKFRIDQYNVPFFESLDAYLNTQPDVDVFNICTPNGYHAEHAIKCLDAEKHVVIEKPVALSKADAERIVCKAEKVGRNVFAVMQNRYSPPSVWLKELVESGRLGKIFMVQLNCYWNRDSRYYKAGNWHGTKSLDGGTLYTQFSHFIDIMYWLFGDIQNISSRFSDFSHSELTEFEDSGLVSFDFVNGGIGCLNFSTSVWDKNLESSITVIAENGSVRVGGQYMDRVEFCHIKDYSMPGLKATNPGNDYGDFKGSAMNHNFLIENVIDVLNGKAEATINIKEGLKVVDIIERIYKSNDILTDKMNADVANVAGI